jgi:hypothetical protein
MLGDYATAISAALAGANTVISVILSHFFKDNRLARVALVGASVAFAVIITGISVYSARHEITEREAREAKQKQVREQLGSFIEEGDRLMDSCRIQANTPPTKEIEQWRERVVDFLEANLGHSFVVRFRDRTGVTLTELMIADADHQNAWTMVYFYVARLHEFSRQLPS